MKKLLFVAGVLLLASSLATADAAPVSGKKGIQNSQKVMKNYRDRYQTVQQIKQKARAQRNAQRQTTGAAQSSGS